MSKELSESAIVKAVAEQAALRVTRKAIDQLQEMDQTLSFQDSGLQNTWEEICVQVQYVESFSWDAYDETVRVIVAALVSGLPKHEKEALWLQTDAGFDWDCEETDQRSKNPVIGTDIVDYLLAEHVYAEAGRWTNERIRDFIDRSSMSD
jgi:hypothetical protein